MISIKEYIQNNIPYTDIALTRGDDATLVLPIYVVAADGTKSPYTLDQNDSVEVQVRKDPVTQSGITPAIIINGIVTVVDGVPNWKITHSQSDIACGVYYWDAQITTSAGDVYTFYQGRLIITPEVTI